MSPIFPSPPHLSSFVACLDYTQDHLIRWQKLTAMCSTRLLLQKGYCQGLIVLVLPQVWHGISEVSSCVEHWIVSKPDFAADVSKRNKWMRVPGADQPLKTPGHLDSIRPPTHFCAEADDGQSLLLSAHTEMPFLWVPSLSSLLIRCKLCTPWCRYLSSPFWLDNSKASGSH